MMMNLPGFPPCKNGVLVDQQVSVVILECLIERVVPLGRPESAFFLEFNFQFLPDVLVILDAGNIKEKRSARG